MTASNYKKETFEHLLLWQAETEIEYVPEGKKKGTKSYDRYEIYSKAKTVAEALELGSLPLDLVNDYEKKLLKRVGGPLRERPLNLQEVADTKTLTKTDLVIGKWGYMIWRTDPPTKKQKSQQTDEEANDGEAGDYKQKKESYKSAVRVAKYGVQFGINAQDLPEQTHYSESPAEGAARARANVEAKERLAAAVQEGRKLNDEDVSAVLRLYQCKKNHERKNIIPSGTEWAYTEVVGPLLKLIGGRFMSTFQAKEYPHIFSLLAQWLKDNKPEEFQMDFPFTSIIINKNFAAKRHRDSHNAGPTLIKSFGNHEGGGLVYFAEDDKSIPIEDLRDEDAVSLDVHDKLVLINGNRVHAVEPYTGDERFSVVFFTASHHSKAPEEVKEQCIHAGCNWPTEEAEAYFNSLLPAPKGYVKSYTIKPKKRLFDTEKPQEKDTALTRMLGKSSKEEPDDTSPASKKQCTLSPSTSAGNFLQRFAGAPKETPEKATKMVKKNDDKELVQSVLKKVSDKKPDDETRRKADALIEASVGLFGANADPDQTDGDIPPEEGDEKDVGPKDFHVDMPGLIEIARRTWGVEAGDAEGLASRSFDVSSLPALPDGRLPFKIVAMALELCNGESPQTLRALTHVFRWVLQRSSDRRADLKALLAILLSPPAPHPQVVAAVGAAFQLKTVAGNSMTACQSSVVSAEQCANLALQNRRGQTTLFCSRSLSVAEIASAMDPSSGQHKASLTKEHETNAGPLMKLLGKAKFEHREIWHLVRVLQGRTGLAKSISLRAVAYAFQLLGNGGDEKDMAQFGKELFRAWAERGSDPNWIVNQLLPPDDSILVAGQSMESSAAAQCGYWVRPMKAHNAANLEEIAEKVSGIGPLRAEWLMDGQRVQVHVKEKGTQIQVFECRGLDTNFVASCEEYTKDVASLLKGNLQNDGDAILEASLMWALETPDNTKKVHALVIFDAVMLGGRPLTRSTFRARRAKLEDVVVETPRLILAPGSELNEEAPFIDAAKIELINANGASVRAIDEDAKVVSRTSGLVFKALDGPQSEYFPGVIVQYQQALTASTPAVQGSKAEELFFGQLSEEERSHLPGANEFHFVVVSARRTQTEEGVQDILTVQRMFKLGGVSPRWYVDQQSLADYQRLGLDAVVGGKLIPARNMALDDAEKLGKACVQCSDDIEKWHYLVEPGGWSKICPNGQKKTLHEANALSRMCERYQVSPVAAARFILAKMRAHPEKPQLGGVLPHQNRGQAMMLPPVSYHHFIVGDFFVVDKSPCRFDTRMTLKEDYDITCAHLKTHGAVVRCNHLMIFAKHETNAGGACSTRDADGERERENIRILMDKYPGAFIDNAKRPNQIIMQWKWRKTGAKLAAAEQSIKARAQLEGMKTSVLRKKAIALGASEEDLGGVDDNNAVREALIQFIVAVSDEVDV